MKKFIIFIAATAMLAVSCQKGTLEPGDTGGPSATGKLTATFAMTKVTYTQTGNNLQPAWEIGDEIIGFDDAGNTYTLTVASVSDGIATLSGTVPDGALHLIYKSGAQASDIISKTLAIDYTAQAGDKTIPAVMLSDGTVTGGACDFAFTNAGAILGIYVADCNDEVPAGTTISKITVEGKNLSAATVALSGSALALIATENADDAISTASLSGITITDDDGTLSSPVFLAIPAGAKISKVSFHIPREPETMRIPSTAADKEGIDYVTIGGVKWAKWNVGASCETDYGWYFCWASTVGYVFEGKKWWQPAKASSYEYSIPDEIGSQTPGTIIDVYANDYLYVDSFTIHRGVFFITETPYALSTTRWTKYITSEFPDYWAGEGSPDNKRVLDLEDDAANANWGGSWRMPTYAEVLALVEACCDYDRRGEPIVDITTNPSGSSATVGRGAYWCSSYDGVAGLLFCDGTNRLFFPAAGVGDYNRINYEGTRCGCWSSTLASHPGPSNIKLPSHAWALEYEYNYHSLGIDNNRSWGYPVRPVLEQ